MLHRLCEDGLTGNLRRVRMYKISTATTNHYTVGVRIRLDGRDGLRKPGDRQTGVDDTNKLVIFVLDGLAVASDHLKSVGRRIEIHIRLRPAGFVQQLWHEIPVCKEILVVVTAALYRSKTVTNVFGVSREIAALVLKIIRFKGNRTGVEVGIVQ